MFVNAAPWRNCHPCTWEDLLLPLPRCYFTPQNPSHLCIRLLHTSPGRYSEMAHVKTGLNDGALVSTMSTGGLGCPSTTLALELP